MMRSTSLAALLSLTLSLTVFSVSAYEYPDCRTGPLAGSPICDPNAPITVRARDFVSKLNVSEKITRLYSGFGAPSPAIPRLGIPGLQWINDALHGITAGPNFKYANGNGAFNSSTSFPSPINFAASFNDRLAFELGNAIGVEARAFTNANRGGVDLWTPNINPFRDPRWGRGQEVPGEDAYMGSRYAYSFVTGMQGGEDPRYYKAVADCKHWAAYDLEDWGGVQRYAFSANVSTKELVEYFMRPFEGCIRDARAGSIMCSYNAVNGVPTCANDFLLQTVARELWEYDTLGDGVILSDCDAVGNIYDSHHYRPDPAEDAALALKAGCDLDCGDFYGRHLPDAFTKGMINEIDLDKSAIRLTQSLIRTGYFDPADSQPYRKYGPERVNSRHSYDISYQAAVQSITMLKNTPKTLPLSSSQPLKIALIGPLATDEYFIQGNYRGKPSYVISLMAGISAESNVHVTFVQGCEVESNKTSGFDAAVEAAKAADYTIFVGGITESQESEGHDRRSLEWPGVQEQLILQLADSISSPLIVVVMGGGQVDMSKEKSAKNVGAILWMGYPSQFGGRAVADVIFGRFSPSGRLVTTQYPAGYISVPMTEMSLRPNKATGNPGRTYMWYTGEPIYPFGYGLSYTTFVYDFLDMAPAEIEIASLIAASDRWSVESAREEGGLMASPKKDRSAAPFVTYAANVTNAGNVISDTSVLVFIKPGTPDSPNQQLVQYAHVSQLPPKASTVVYFDVSMNSIAKVDDNGDRWLVPGEYIIFIGHAGHVEHSHTFRLIGETSVLQVWPRENAAALAAAKVAHSSIKINAV